MFFGEELVFGWKSDEVGFATRAEARFLARGCGQRETGIDFFEAFAPTLTASCNSLLLGAIACELDLDLCHFGAEQDFVLSNLEEDAFMRLPQGRGEMFGKVVRSSRSLYGLKQASGSWHNHLIGRMKSLAFEQRLVDACVMRLVEVERFSTVTAVHVDDIFAVGLKAGCDQFCEDLNRLVPPINNLGELNWYAGYIYFLGIGMLVLRPSRCSKLSLKTQLRSLASVRAGETRSRKVSSSTSSTSLNPTATGLFASW